MQTARKQLQGKVVSDRMEKTVVIETDTIITHSLYKKFVRRRKKIKVHDERNESHVGDIVRVEETRPLSKDKRYRLITIVEKAK